MLMLLQKCATCGGRSGLRYRSPLDGEPRCQECARAEVIGLLEGADDDDLAKLRRRAEDCLRKNPSIMLRVAVDLAVSGTIRWRDLI
jgi:recombinational DNA repair protein (RecF pathway)